MKKWGSVIIVIVGFTGLSWGRGPGLTSGVSLTLPADTRGAGMGEAFSAAASGVRGLWYNPATLARHPDITLTLTHTQFIENISYDSFGAAVPFGSKNAVALGGQFLRMAPIDAYDYSGTSAGSFSPQDTTLLLGYGKTIHKTSAGVTMKYLNSTIKDTAKTIAWDIGFHQELNNVSVGYTREHTTGSLR